MTARTSHDLYYDPYDVDLIADPYPMFARLREEAPVHHDERGFWAVSRYDDVARGLTDDRTFLSGRGNILELIESGMEIPSGLLVMEDAPRHDIHRKLLSRMFTPRKIAELEDTIRSFCAASLDPALDSGRFDFVRDLGAQMPMRTVSTLLGIPDAGQEAIRDHSNAQMNTEAGAPMAIASDGFDDGQIFAEYIDWRREHPSDDIVTELLNVEFTDENGAVRRLTRDELLMYVNVVAAAGNETTTRLIGWAGKVLAEHPDQRRQLAEDPSLIPNAVEELLRFEPPAPHVARYVAHDAQFHGTTIPAGSTILLLVGGANRDPRRFPPDGDVFDIHRTARSHLAFGVGAHYCLGAALARLEGRVALEEILTRLPVWDVDLGAARMSTTSTVRGWESMPAVLQGVSA